MGTPETGSHPEQETPAIGKKMADLLRRYANPADSRQHTAIAEEIRKAVRSRDKDGLLEQLSFFGNARNDETGTERMQMVEMFCSRESQAIIADLNQTESMPWNELSSSLGITTSPVREQESAGPKKPELSPADLENTETFIDTFILHNEALTPQAKEMVVNETRSRRGPWSVKDFVLRVDQEGNKVTVRTKNGAAFLYVK